MRSKQQPRPSYHRWLKPEENGEFLDEWFKFVTKSSGYTLANFGQKTCDWFINFSHAEWWNHFTLHMCGDLNQVKVSNTLNIHLGDLCFRSMLVRSHSTFSCLSGGYIAINANNSWFCAWIFCPLATIQNATIKMDNLSRESSSFALISQW